MTTNADAVVVGSGPNGLAAAITLAQHGLAVRVLEAADTVGGGSRTAQLTVPGVRHDVCSAIHPLAAASPFFASLALAEHGLEWRWPEVDLAHPLDGDRAALMVRSLDDTVAGLGADGDTWRRSFGPLAARFDDLADDVLGPLLRRPRHPAVLARFGLLAALPATVLAGRFRTDAARALIAGCAAHVIRPLTRPATASVAALLIAAGHRAGWPVAAGGSQALADALAGLLISLGGKVETGARVSTLAELDQASLRLLDTSPRALVSIAGDRLPAGARRAFTRWRYGPGAFKLDLAVDGGVPWRADACCRAGTVHVGGRLEEIVAAEAEVHRGGVSPRPFVLVAQQYLCDPQRSQGGIHPVWAYTHVPNGYAGDPTEAILGQIERFAPGFRERIVGRHVMAPADYEAYDANLVGGDIAVGSNDARQLLIRPRLTLDPYATGIPGVYLCSAATPPGPGAHGMCGHHAALRALRDAPKHLRP